MRGMEGVPALSGRGVGGAGFSLGNPEYFTT
jgi:hypothetical protein